MGGSSNQPQQTTTTQLAPQAQQILGAATPGITNFLANPPARYPGSTVAGFTPAQEQAQQMGLTAGQEQTQAAQDYLRRLTGYTPSAGGQPGFTAEQLPGMENIFGNPGVWDPRLNPGLQEAMQAATRPLYQN